MKKDGCSSVVTSAGGEDVAVLISPSGGGSVGRGEPGGKDIPVGLNAPLLPGTGAVDRGGKGTPAVDTVGLDCCHFATLEMEAVVIGGGGGGKISSTVF